RTLKYLKGETIEAEEDLKDGLVLVCVDSYPLGFAQNKNGTLKNKYPKERRMR
ncbi:MAG: SAM-dependent methyltransferase, partial [Erysipelotrichaceae bacterium]|nr:SAM-dependent methyltransferase [Erysipelotrichaceae bacterium]